MTNWRVWKNRVCFALVFGFAATQASAADLSISAAPSPAVVGSPVVLSINIANVADLYGFQLSLAFDPTILQANTVTEGGFLAGGGSTIFDGGTIDNTAGTISFSFGTLVGAIPGVSGSGLLEQISFSTIGVGTSALNFSDVLFLNSNLGDVTINAINGSLQAVNPTVPAIPEPETYALFAVGLVAVALARRRTAR